MSNEPQKQPPPEPRKPPHIELKLKTFPVDYVKAKPGADFDVPGRLGSSITTDVTRPENRDYHWIDFVPEMHSFAVWFVTRAYGKRCVYIPYDNVRSWAPLL